MTVTPKKVAERIEAMEPASFGVGYVTLDWHSFRKHMLMSPEDIERKSTSLPSRRKIEDLKKVFGHDSVERLIAATGSQAGLLAITNTIRCFRAVWKVIMPAGRLLVGMTDVHNDPTKLIADVIFGPSSFVGYPPWPQFNPPAEVRKLLCYEKGHSKPVVDINLDREKYKTVFKYSPDAPADYSNFRSRSRSFMYLLLRRPGPALDASFSGSREFRKGARHSGLVCLTVAGRLNQIKRMKPGLERIHISKEALSAASEDFNRLNVARVMYYFDKHYVRIVLAWLRGSGEHAEAERFIASVMQGKGEYYDFFPRPNSDNKFIKNWLLVPNEFFPLRAKTPTRFLLKRDAMYLKIRLRTVNYALRMIFNYRMDVHKKLKRKSLKPTKEQRDAAANNTAAPPVYGREFMKREDDDPSDWG